MIFGPMTVSCAENNTGSVTYKVYIDPGYGFYKVRDVTTFKAAPYDIINHTLTIRQGDAIAWVNDADTKVSLSIVSDQGLWKGAAKLDKTYIFTYAGTYTFYIAEYSGKKQTVIINPTEGYLAPTTPVPTTTPEKTPEVAKVPTSDITNMTTPTASIHTKNQTNETINTSSITNSSINSSINSTGSFISDFLLELPSKEIPIKFSPTMIASVIVAILSIYTTYRAGKNS